MEIKRDTISRVTDAVMGDVEAWRTRPLETVYPIVYFDALMVKIREDRSVRSRACYLAIGVTIEGEREVLGIWWQETEGAKFWLAVLNDLHQRGVADVLVACVDGLTGFPEAIEAVFPEAWVQTCIVHQIRNSMRFVAYKDRKAVARDLKPVYRAVNADAAAQALQAFDETWGERYPMIAAVLASQAGNTSSRSSRCPPTCAAPSTPPTASRTSTARSAKRSRPAATSPTNRPPPSSSTWPSSEPKERGRSPTTGPAPSEASRSTSETDSPTDTNHVASASHTEVRTVSRSHGITRRREQPSEQPP